MEDARFDALAKRLASGLSRRDVLRGLASMAGAGIFSLAGRDAAAAHDPLSSHEIGSALAGGRAAARAMAATLGGDDNACIVYVEHLRAEYSRYLWERHAYYADEQRWSGTPFWERRHNNGHARTTQAQGRSEIFRR